MQIYAPFRICFFCLQEKNNNSVDDNSDNMSEISNLSGLSEEAWKPTSGDKNYQF